MPKNVWQGFGPMSVDAAEEFRGVRPDGRDPCPPDPLDGAQHRIYGNGQLGEAGVTKSIPSPLVQPLESSTNFWSGNFDVAIPGAVGAVVPVASFRAPDNQVGALNQISQYISAPLVGQRYSWSVVITGGQVAGFSGLKNPPFTGQVFYLITNGMALRIPAGALVTLQVENLSGVAGTVGGEISGWYQSQVAEDRAWNLKT